jgi:thioredoxin-related protein
MQVLKFTKDMCMECMVTKNLQKEDEGFFKEVGVSIEEVDALKETALVEKHGVSALPTFVLLNDNQDPQYFYKIAGYHQMKEALNDAVHLR